MDAWITAKDAARLYGVSAGTIGRWASQDHWRRLPTWPRKYAWEDAQASYERRHATPATQNGPRHLRNGL